MVSVSSDDFQNMARFLRGVYSKVSCHPKFRSYATKPNPYEEVLKTLRLWEQDLKNKTNSSRNNEEYSSKSCQTDSSFNLHEDLHFNEFNSDVNFSRTKKADERNCDNALSNDDIFKTDNCDIQEKLNFREQELENESKNFFPKDEEILIFTPEHFCNRFILENETSLATHPQEATESIKHSQSTTNKILSENESLKTKRKKSERTTVKSSSTLEKEETQMPNNECLSFNSLPVNETKILEGDLNSHRISTDFPTKETSPEIKTDKKSQKSGKKSKKSVKSETQLSLETSPEIKTYKKSQKSGKKSKNSVKSKTQLSLETSPKIKTYKKSQKSEKSVKSETHLSLDLENESKNFLSKDKEILIFTPEHFSNRFILKNKTSLATYPQEATESIKHSQSTTNKILSENESLKTKRKKSERTTAKSSSTLEKEETQMPNNECLSLNSLPVNETKILEGDLNSHRISTDLPTKETSPVIKTDKKSQKSGKKSKKSVKSETQLSLETSPEIKTYKKSQKSEKSVKSESQLSLELENESKNFFSKDKEILIFTPEHFSNRFMLENETSLATYPQETTESIKHSQSTTNKILSEYESLKSKRKKSESTTAKSSSRLEKEETQMPNNECLSLSSLPVNESKILEGDLNPHRISTDLPTKETSSEIETDKKSEKFVKSETQLSIEEFIKEAKENRAIRKSEKKSKKPVKSETELLLEELKKEARENRAIQSLKSSIEAHMNADKMEQAQRYFDYLHKSKKKRYLNVELYNLIISGWAHLGQLDKVKHLFSLMHKDNIVPNLMTYAGYLEAIARNKCIDVAEISNIINKMKEQGFTPKELLQKGIFIGSQREQILQVLGFVEQDLSLPLYVPEDAYSFKLLEKLNDKNYEKEEAHFNYCYQAEDIPKITAEQMEMESLSAVKVKSINTVPEINEKVKKTRDYLKKCEKRWREILRENINDMKSSEFAKGQSFCTDRGAIHSYLSLIDTEVLVDLLLMETRMLAETAEFYSPGVKVLYNNLGMKVMRLYFMALNIKNGVTDKVSYIYQKYLNYLLNPDLCAKYSPREYWEFLKSKYCDGPTIDISNVCWPYSLIVYIGSVLYGTMKGTICFIPSHIIEKSDNKYITPAFYIKYEMTNNKLHKQIRTHVLFAKLYRDAKLEYLEFDATLVPMLSPPHPWVKYDSGGLLITKVPFIRFPEHAQSIQSSYYSKHPSKQFNAYFDSLNSLSLCPWIINKPILDIAIKIFQEGGSEELDIPLNPANFKMEHESPSTESGESSKASAMINVREYEKKKQEMTSLWFDCLYKLSIANHFRDQIFWFPHNLDFRGRVYPTPPHFNHLGSDLPRSILLFAYGKPLGKKGLDWLKIHLINLTGFKKRASNAERLAYANEILPDILDSADNPFGGKRWWMTSDKPLQTLACCKELASAVRHPNPEEYISHLPVHQDGSCNGLQHYAALGRDEPGAIEVNLHPSDTPQDVYSGVAALVEKERYKDAKEGLEIAQVLDGFITRKVVKQTVMTFVYGVTSYGARLQVLKQLKDMSDFPEKYQHEAATYLMKKIFFSIKEMFTATKKIQDWFTQCADEITKVAGDPVEWVTPLGLPVTQPYYKETVVRSSRFCASKHSDLVTYSSSYEPYELPNVRKQKNAFAPNFIHSLDSSHMMLTSLICHRKGITFASVHDCYWTHSVTVAAMNRICREQFVSLHNEPILENLSKYFLERYASLPHGNGDSDKKNTKERKKMQSILSAVPDKGTFDLKLVLDSEYFFS